MQGSERIEDFRPIALANFQFKIITKVLASRLFVVAPKIISSHQRGFIHGRSIKDCICIASEAINMLDHKTFGGNIAIKLDIKKAFDTLEWDFLLQTLKTFGFNQTFIKWISLILHSAKLSINVNGHNIGFFNCCRGVRQGDPLSPILFCLAEEVLSRGITKLVIDNKLSTITGPMNLQSPSHVLFADDILIFCKASKRNLICLKKLVKDYAMASGQQINISKSRFYTSITNHSRIASISATLGKPKKLHLQPIADRIINKMSKWKGSSLSLMGRVELVDNCARNFIWSGDIAVKKLVTVAWYKVCSYMEEGGLGIKSFKCLNKAYMLKLTWELKTSNLDWAIFFRSKFNCQGHTTPKYSKSSIWPGIRDNWLQGSIANFTLDSKTIIPGELNMNFPSLSNDIAAYKRHKGQDKLIWMPSLDGSMTSKDAFHSFQMNQKRFEDRMISSTNALSRIRRETSYSGSYTSSAVASGSLQELQTLKFFNITLKLSKAPNYIEVLWKSPQWNWTKANTDGAAHGNPGPAGGGGIFRDHNADFIYAFANFLNVHNAIHAELHSAMKAVDIAFKKGWHNLWLESDSMLVLDIFSGNSKAPWKLSNDWQICKSKIAQMNFKISHIYREGNVCADKLASYDISSHTNSIWFSTPPFIIEDFARNRHDLPNYRFRNL
ncbi:PREDICTED: uncharacterized protein LOC109353847 [Lupinus angustifolius]|uniref:uncharacterized protein LOC109353847 n=1 Tax=Lupinus angustifolius TaxID=3871 RepID=UPI00092E30A4|nr:PREDICTED: uncharacterized protein LOC109353847 [Lupinus angustifolius]